MTKNNFSTDADFTRTLGQRPVVPPSTNLTARIVAAAVRRAKAIPNMPLGQWLQELFADFMLPKPAYALGGVLVVGFLVGFMVLPMMMIEDSSASTQIMLADEGDMP